MKTLDKERQIQIAGLKCLIANGISHLHLEEFSKHGGVTGRTKQHIRNASKHIREITQSRIQNLDNQNIDSFNYLYEGLDAYVSKIAQLDPELQVRLSETMHNQSININKHFHLGFKLLIDSIGLEHRKEANELKQALDKLMARAVEAT